MALKQFLLLGRVLAALVLVLVTKEATSEIIKKPELAAETNVAPLAFPILLVPAMEMDVILMIPFSSSATTLLHYYFLQKLVVMLPSSTSHCLMVSCKSQAPYPLSIHEGVVDYLTLSSSYDNHTKVHNFNPCGYTFVADDTFNFSSNLANFQSRVTVPVVLDWSVGNETCETAKENVSAYACRAAHSTCVSSTNGGYRCICLEGFGGNPNLFDGCQDVNECESSNPCTDIARCHNFDGSFKCICPKGYDGDGKRDTNGTIGCISKYRSDQTALRLHILLGICIGLLLLSVATSNYDENMILGQGGYGTVYKGVLADNKLVTIKMSKIGDQSQIEQFINEIIMLSQINHRNVVKLIGCCSETELPLLVYDFKTANILLDDNYNAKVADFGASRLVPNDQTQLTTLVQGTMGYLDPEYFHTSQLTEKSDVYNFGVVLAELLSGEKALCPFRRECDKNLATYFVSSMKEDRLLQILDHHINDVVADGHHERSNGSIIQQVKVVANLVKRCVSVRGEDRPTTKEVETELEGLIKDMHPWAQDENDILRRED
ncbi:hypothetical protein FNV43_RR07099 [Rhamnella rubrinervis]|uniref:Uncharacterized protein n=1 Tax=Rhamnella rubrinervis TaxID=2594499 RepID=A0A8K0MMM3_9ROSA|nr:hypothetical protein FNV43_RR07099 [Rhamnella rubrinervis]